MCKVVSVDIFFFVFEFQKIGNNDSTDCLKFGKLFFVFRLFRQHDVCRKALTFTFKFLSFFLHRNTALGDCGEATHQMYTRGSVVGGA